MRFINTTTHSFQEVPDSDLLGLQNGYSILSHRWGDDEVLYEDILAFDYKDMLVLNHEDTLLFDQAVRKKSGYVKLISACAVARDLGFDLLWIDTCCINKTDSVELGEAINSMYRWYSCSRVCIAYLGDVNSIAELPESDWFNRGWTLQELIASKVTRFYGRSWNLLGTKAHLSTDLSSRTGIPVDVLENRKPPQDYSIAQRMSWAAKRVTKRLEDRAYSLLGLFDVNMAMIYGEREHAFIRLQEQIILRSTDESIFAWDPDLLEDSSSQSKSVCYGLFSPSPTCFANSGTLVSTGHSSGFRIDQFGFRIPLSAIHWRGLHSFLVCLNVIETSSTKRYAMFLDQLSDRKFHARSRDSKGRSFLLTQTQEGEIREFMIPIRPMALPPRIYPGFWLRTVDVSDSQIAMSGVLSRGHCREKDRIMLPIGKEGTVGVISLILGPRSKRQTPGLLKFGFDDTGDPACFMALQSPSTPVRECCSGSQDLFQATETQSGTTEWHNLPLFQNDWLLYPSRGIPLRCATYVDSRATSRKVGDVINITLRTPSLAAKMSISKLRDMDPHIQSQGIESHVWTVDAVLTSYLHSPVESSLSGTTYCCGC